MSGRDSLLVLPRVEVECDRVAQQRDIVLSVSSLLSRFNKTHRVLLASHCKGPRSLRPVLPHFSQNTEDMPGDMARDVLLHGGPGHCLGLLLLRERSDRSGEGQRRVQRKSFQCQRLSMIWELLEDGIRGFDTLFVLFQLVLSLG